MPASVIGLGLYLPEQIVTNQDLVNRGLATTDEWIVAHTGIRERRIAAANQATSDLAVAAAERALADAGVSAEDVDLIVCATSTPDHLLPATANLIQHRLGLKAGGFDINAGCSGFVHGLSLSFALQESGRYRHVLFVAADTYSRFVDWTDRSTAVFFGDGAAAVVLGPSRANWLLATVQGSDGSGASAITIPAGGSRLPADPERLLARQAFFQMRGGDVRAFALGTVPQAIRHVVTKAGLRLSDLSLVITHQANARIIEGCADQLGIERERMFVNVDRYANTAAASAGIALAEAVQTGRVKAGDNVVVVGFGSGLGWAATCLRWGERGRLPAGASS